MPLTPTEIRDWTIYKITNPNGEVYIGKTNNYRQRIRQYKCPQIKQPNLITRSFVKYGFERHNFEIIESFVGTGQESESKERFWIRSYMSNSCKFTQQNGMNMTDGGGGVLGLARSESFRKQVGDRCRGGKHSLSHRKKISDSLWGHKRNVGRKQSEEEKEKRAAKLRGRKVSEEYRAKVQERNTKLRGIRIIQVSNTGEVIKEFGSLKIASNETGLSTHIIRHLLRKDTRPNLAHRHIIFKYK